MSNFQRTRSKVWWGDSSPNFESPIAAPVKDKSEDNWEPQLPHWIGNQPPPDRNNNANVEVANVPNQWPLRHGSPGSHKSQDSGFSDSDSSPPPSQYYPSPDNDSKATNKSSSSSDSNNNENITVKEVIINTPKRKDVIDCPKIENVKPPIPKPRLRSSSVIQTPYDLQKYYEVHNDEEHIALLKDDPEVPLNKSISVQENSNKYDESSENKAKLKENVTMIEIKPSPRKINKENTLSAIVKETKDTTTNIISPSKKYPTKKQFVCSQESDGANIIKMAKVKDLGTSRHKSDESLEYIKLSNNNEIAVKNQPRMRSPIANISYIPTERSSNKKEYRRSVSNEENIPITTTPKFQRNRLNKSLNTEGQKLDQQILNIQDGHHSLGYIDEEKLTQNIPEEIHQPTKALLGKNIMDSLNLKPTKKVGPRSKQRIATKTDKKDLLDPPPLKAESRVPSLGLPRSVDQNEWVIVGPPEQERLIPNYTERLIDGPKEVSARIPKHRRISPPPQFKDKQNIEVKHKEFKRDKLKEEDLNYGDIQLDLGCTSTPKMLPPRDFMRGLTPFCSDKDCRKNLMDSFTGVILNNKDELLYRERSIDQTTLERLCDRKPEPVQYWLCDLIGSVDNECMTTLQSKPIGTEMKAMVSASSATITGNIKKVQTHGQIIIHQYSDIIRQFEENGLSEEQICLLVANINEFVLTHSITLNTKPPGESPERWDKIKKSLQSYLQKLIDLGEDIKIELNETNPEWNVIAKHLDGLIGIFLDTTKAVLVQQMKTLVSIIEEPPSDMILKSTLTSIGHLAVLSENTENSLPEKCSKIMKSITELPFVDCGVPRALLTAVIESKKSSVKSLSLRALATVCVTGDAVRQFEEGGGIEILSDILSDPSNPEPQMREAITVLTQITAPWLRGHYDLTQLHLYLDTIVRSITGILYRTSCCQLLLLSTACLVNLARELEAERGADTDIVGLITKHKTLEKLLDAVKRRGPHISVFLQEQTASLLASLSRLHRSLILLSSIRGVCVALVCFIRCSPTMQQRDAERRAHAALHCHSAEAIARICILPEVCHQIVDLEGVPHLINLVRMQRHRPLAGDNPDQTLIHCIKALRCIYKNVPKAFQDFSKDVEDMIKPHLMESLMLFSVKQESYV